MSATKLIANTDLMLGCCPGLVRQVMTVIPINFQQQA